jgi:hypothetical protein
VTAAPLVYLLWLSWPHSGHSNGAFDFDWERAITELLSDCRFAQSMGSSSGETNSRRFEAAYVLVCLNHVASFIVNANHSMRSER